MNTESTETRLRRLTRTGTERELAGPPPPEGPYFRKRGNHLGSKALRAGEAAAGIFFRVIRVKRADRPSVSVLSVFKTAPPVQDQTPHVMPPTAGQLKTAFSQRKTYIPWRLTENRMPNLPLSPLAGRGWRALSGSDMRGG